MDTLGRKGVFPLIYVERVVMKFSGALQKIPIIGLLCSRVYPTFRKLAPPLLEGVRAQIMTQDKSRSRRLCLWVCYQTSPVWHSSLAEADFAKI